jgi:hypothetical protein
VARTTRKDAKEYGLLAAAHLSGVSAVRIAEWCREGVLRAHRVGGHWFIPESVVWTLYRGRKPRKKEKHGDSN